MHKPSRPAYVGNAARLVRTHSGSERMDSGTNKSAGNQVWAAYEPWVDEAVSVAQIQGRSFNTRTACAAAAFGIRSIRPFGSRVPAGGLLLCSLDGPGKACILA